MCCINNQLTFRLTYNLISSEFSGMHSEICVVYDYVLSDYANSVAPSQQ